MAANVRAEVARQRVPQVRIAGSLGVTQSGVSKRLRGLVPFSIDELHAIACLLDVPLAVLLDGVDTTEQEAS